MAEGDDEGEYLDPEEFFEAMEQSRRECREQVSYEWVETIRAAGELYREANTIDAVSKELNRPEASTREALTIYRLVFEDPSDEVTAKASDVGRAYFSLKEDVSEAVDEDEEEETEDLLCEYVGAIYLKHDINEESVGDPPEKSTPPLSIEWEEITEQLEEIHSELFQPLRGLSLLPEVYFKPEQLLPKTLLEPGVLYPRTQFVQAAVTAGLPDLTKQLQLQQSLVNAAVTSGLSDVMSEVRFPSPVIADLAAIQSTINASAISGAAATPQFQQDSDVADVSPTTLDDKPVDVSQPTIPSADPAGATVDATLPDQETFSSELVFEIPGMLVQSILSTGQARIWFSNLPEDHQITVVRLLLATIVVSLTGNPFFAPIAIIPAPAIRRAILVVDSENE